ncbi:hypothetical protein TPA0910_80690 [Streptomyces hygroscopicus subsp. sporocinereus]|uniref:Uncharacterized protein n=1 Tax=Streptomyces hygroscopicus TaxID=1912 RepID=A0ABQ3UEP0_STRHY|nr:hypothetical protein TPA0910_80690 [Streptomyces hygroscopicus]
MARPGLGGRRRRGSRGATVAGPPNRPGCRRTIAAGASSDSRAGGAPPAAGQGRARADRGWAPPASRPSASISPRPGVETHEPGARAVFLGREDPYARRPPSTDIAVPVT